MQFQEFYTRVGGDAASVLDRLGTEELIVRFVRKFPADTSYTQLCEAMDQGDAALTEELRAGKLEEAKAWLPGVREKYEELVGLIAEL